MRPNTWLSCFVNRPATRPAAPASRGGKARPVLEPLEDRLAPAVLNATLINPLEIDLSYTGATSEVTTVTRTLANYNFSNPTEPITVTGTGAIYFLGSGTNTVTAVGGAVNADHLAMTGSGLAGSGALIQGGGITPALIGLSITNFDNITARAAVHPSGNVILAANARPTSTILLDGMAVQAANVSLTAGNAGAGTIVCGTGAGTTDTLAANSLTLSAGSVSGIGGPTLEVDVTGPASLGLNGSLFGGFAALHTVPAGGTGAVSLTGTFNGFGQDTFATPVVLAGATTLSGTAIVFDNTLDGAFGLTLNGPATLAGAVGGTAPPTSLTFNAPGADTVSGAVNLGPGVAFQGSAPIVLVSGKVSGTGGLTMDGSGALVLSYPNNDYTGQTVVNSGTLEVDGAQPNSPILLNGGRLTGSGTVGPVTVAGGAFSPGAGGGTGRLNTGDLSLSPGTTLVVHLNGTTPGTGYDQLNVTGTVSLGGATLQVFPGFTPPVGTTFVIVNNDGTDPVTGAFNGLPEGSVLTAGGDTFRISYAGGDGNDVVLTAVAPVGSITVSVFFDPNCNGGQDAGEAGLAGRTVYLDLNDNGRLDPGEPSAVTDGSGHATFTGLAPGAYQVREDLSPAPGVLLTGAGAGGFAAAVPAGGTAGAAFGNLFDSPVAPVVANVNLFGPGHPADANTAYVEGLYRAVLGRDGDSGGVAYWVGLLNSGATRQQVARGFWDSPEHRGLEVDEYYQSFLHRAADPAGRAYWINQFLAGTDETGVVQGFVTSVEFQAAHPGNDSFVRDLYFDILGRAPDAGGLSYWDSQLDGGASRWDVARGFILSNEAAVRATDGFYTAYLHRVADPTRQFWVGPLTSGRMSYGDAAAGVLGSGEFFGNAAAAAV